MQKNTIEKLLKIEDENLHKMHEIIVACIEEEKELASILYKEASDDSELTIGQKLADKVASFGGSWVFIIYFGVFLCIWMAINIYQASKSFDPYPFILLNLILSCIAAIQAPIIMMSQNRQEEKDRQRAEHDYLINLKAELQTRELNKKLDLLMVDQMSVLLKLQEEQYKYIESLHGKLDKHLKTSGHK